jgi:hypothetical protein
MSTIQEQRGGMGIGTSFACELGVAVLRGARAMDVAHTDLLAAVTAEEAAEAAERLELIIRNTIIAIRLYDTANI